MRFVWPLDSHYITRGFYFQSSIYIGGQHAAVDLVRLGGGTAGRGILAVADGVVVSDAFDTVSGYYIALEHAEGWRSMYRHLVADAPPVMGQQIAQGQVIGNVGSTGMSTGPHLHFDLWHRQKQDDTAFSKSGWWAHNPELYLGQEDVMTPEDKQFIEAQTAYLEKRQDEIHDVDKKAHAALKAQLDALTGKVDAIQAGGGLTLEETIEANQEAARRGTN